MRPGTDYQRLLLQAIEANKWMRDQKIERIEWDRSRDLSDAHEEAIERLQDEYAQLVRLDDPEAVDG